MHFHSNFTQPHNLGIRRAWRKHKTVGLPGRDQKWPCGREQQQVCKD